MIGIGLDAVDVARFRLAIERRPRLVVRVFTDRERNDLSDRVDPVPGLAARFAAKEATMKALGVGLGSFSFHDVEVVRTEGGAPELRVIGKAAELVAAAGAKRLIVSLTHTASLAGAIVVAT